MKSLFAKRVLDILLALSAVVLLSPLLLVVVIVCWWQHGSPVFFTQQRSGYQGKSFAIVKFRTMNNRCDEQGQLLPDDQRLTRFGQFLRSTSIDELPELWNIVKGEMSIVGPRSLLPAYLPLYTPEQNRRHDTLPGLTGWAQVNGRNALSWEEKFQLDVWYVDNRSLWLDLRIIWLTVRTILRREGISAANHATMAPFTGDTGQ